MGNIHTLLRQTYDGFDTYQESSQSAWDGDIQFQNQSLHLSSKDHTMIANNIRYALQSSVPEEFRIFRYWDVNDVLVMFNRFHALASSKEKALTHDQVLEQIYNNDTSMMPVTKWGYTVDEDTFYQLFERSSNSLVNAKMNSLGSTLRIQPQSLQNEHINISSTGSIHNSGSNNNNNSSSSNSLKMSSLSNTRSMNNNDIFRSLWQALVTSSIGCYGKPHDGVPAVINMLDVLCVIILLSDSPQLHKMYVLLVLFGVLPEQSKQGRLITMNNTIDYERYPWNPLSTANGSNMLLLSIHVCNAIGILYSNLMQPQIDDFAQTNITPLRNFVRTQSIDDFYATYNIHRAAKANTARELGTLLGGLKQESFLLHIMSVFSQPVELAKKSLLVQMNILETRNQQKEFEGLGGSNDRDNVDRKDDQLSLQNNTNDSNTISSAVGFFLLDNTTIMSEQTEKVDVIKTLTYVKTMMYRAQYLQEHGHQTWIQMLAHTPELHIRGPELKFGFLYDSSSDSSTKSSMPQKQKINGSSLVGGVDTRFRLTKATPREVRALSSAFDLQDTAGGGYVSLSVLKNPPQHILSSSLLQCDATEVLNSPDTNKRLVAISHTNQANMPILNLTVGSDGLPINPQNIQLSFVKFLELVYSHCTHDQMSSVLSYAPPPLTKDTIKKIQHIVERCAIENKGVSSSKNIITALFLSKHIYVRMLSNGIDSRTLASYANVSSDDGHITVKDVLSVLQLKRGFHKLHPVWKRVMSWVTHSRDLSAEEMEQIEAQYAKYDTTQQGKVQFTAVLKGILGHAVESGDASDIGVEDILKLLKNVEVDALGLITKSEFILLCKDIWHWDVNFQTGCLKTQFDNIDEMVSACDSHNRELQPEEQIYTDFDKSPFYALLSLDSTVNPTDSGVNSISSKKGSITDAELLTLQSEENHLASGLFTNFAAHVLQNGTRVDRENNLGKVQNSIALSNRLKEEHQENLQKRNILDNHPRNNNQVGTMVQTNAERKNPDNKRVGGIISSLRNIAPYSSMDTFIPSIQTYEETPAIDPSYFQIKKNVISSNNSHSLSHSATKAQADAIQTAMEADSQLLTRVSIVSTSKWRQTNSHNVRKALAGTAKEILMGPGPAYSGTRVARKYV